MARPRKPKLDPLTGKPAVTADELRIAINRLSKKIVNERNQAECDRIELEYQELAARYKTLIIPPKTPDINKMMPAENGWLTFK